MHRLQHIASPMTHVVHYRSDTSLLYFFTKTDKLRLDIDTIADVQSGKSTLYFIFSTGRPEYAVMNDASELRTYVGYSHEMLTQWYDDQSLLDMFIRVKGIHPVMCKRIIRSAPSPLPEQKVKPHLVALVLRDAIAAKKVCSITLEPITNDSVCIAPCYHCFSKEAIEEWLLKNSTCPECRERCV
jgi:hypothetical protein